MKYYSVYWTKSAKQDLREIIDYISKDSKKNALKILNRITQQSAELKQMPFRYRVISEFQDLNIESYRELIISPWRIIFKVVNHKVFVVAVLDGRRNIEDILREKVLSGVK